MNLKKIALFTLTILLLLATELAGQGMSARVTGTVRDEDGKPLAGVLVTAVNTINNATLTATSVAPDGSFRLLGLAPAIYQVSFDLAGYESYTAAGISLSVEQSITLRIKLKRGSANAAPAEATPAPPARADFFSERRKVAVLFNISMNYTAGGDSNAYLKAFNQRVLGRTYDDFRTLHSITDLNLEVGYRVTPKLEIAAALGYLSGTRHGNELRSLTSWKPYIYSSYINDLRIKAFPVQLIGRYWLKGEDKSIYSVYGALLFNFATWNMRMYDQLYDDGSMIKQTEELESATGFGLGFAAGFRLEARLDEVLSFVADLGGRWAPVRNLSGRREYYQLYQVGKPEVSKGKLWFYEFFDQGKNGWVKELGIGERPAGDGVRNVSSATVDFSSLTVRVGLMLRL